jgi:uncharacterized LabA/DUF88 family protein
MRNTFNAYIDGFNLYYGALRERPDLKWLDIRKFAASHFDDVKLDKVYYFSARIKAAFPGDTAPERQNQYWRALRATGVTIVEGKFANPPRFLPLSTALVEQAFRPQPEPPTDAFQIEVSKLFAISHPTLPEALVHKQTEKGSDVNLATYLLRDVYKYELKFALVVTADADLESALQLAKEEGTWIALTAARRHGDVIPRQLSRHANFIEHIKPSVLTNHQLPNALLGLNGKELTRPKDWR